MRDARFLISGAGGFVAGHIAAGLAALGHRVCALDLGFDDAARRRLAGCDLLERDLAREPGDLPPADVIVHGAALTTGPDRLGITPADHLSANTLPLLAMLRHAGRSRPRAFVFLSSSGVFDRGDGSPDLADTDAATAQGPYAAAKRAGEQLVPGALGGFCETFCLRLGSLYGPGEVARPTRQRVSLMQGWCDAATAGGTIEIAADDPRRDWTFAPDLARAIDRLIAARGRVAPLHLCAPGAPRDSEVVALIRAHHPGATVTVGPAAPLKAPMRATPLPALDGMVWTPVADGIAALCRTGVTA